MDERQNIPNPGELSKTPEKITSNKFTEKKLRYLEIYLQKYGNNDNERKVLRALCEGNYTLRSVTGIARDTGMTKIEVRDILMGLINRSAIVEIQSKRTGNLLYQARLSSND